MRGLGVGRCAVMMSRLVLIVVLGPFLQIDQATGACDETCNRCLAYDVFGGHCIMHGIDPLCEARKKECQIRPPNEELQASSTTLLVPARIYLSAAAIPPPQFGAYGVVAFRSKPTSASRDRLLRVCVAFKAHLPRYEILPRFVPSTDLMLTIWPIDDSSATYAIDDDCNLVIEHYDLYGGISAIQDAERQGVTLDGRGPFLIGWSPSNSRGIPDKVVLVVDLSSFESQDSFDEAFLFWQRKIVQDPSLWRSGFSIEGIRLAIRDFLDHYGQDVMKATKIIGIKN